MPINVLMPALSPTMEKGNLAKWLKKEGDRIKSGDILAEIETDKATMEVEAVDEGILAKIIVSEGTADVPVNQPIAVIAEEGEDPKAVGAAQPAAPSMPKAEVPPAQAAPSAPAQQKTPEAEAPVQRADARIDAAPTGPAKAARAGDGADRGPGRVFASPLARRIAKEGGIDLAGIQGSGPHGRVIEKDVRAALAEGPRPTAEAQRPAPAAAPAAPTPAAPALAPSATADQVKALFEPGSYEEMLSLIHI